MGNYINVDRVDLKNTIDYVYKIGLDKENYFRVEKEDLEQELKAIWLKLHKLYLLNSPSIGLRQYLLRMSAWELRDWFSKIEHTVKVAPGTYIDRDDLKISMTSILCRKTWNPFFSLSLYQRYLFHLKYIEGKSILLISKQLQKDRHTLSLQINNVIKTIRRIINGT
jgi:hypothetical protein